MSESYMHVVKKPLDETVMWTKYPNAGNGKKTRRSRYGFERLKVGQVGRITKEEVPTMKGKPFRAFAFNIYQIARNYSKKHDVQFRFYTEPERNTIFIRRIS